MSTSIYGNIILENNIYGALTITPTPNYGFVKCFDNIEFIRNSIVEKDGVVAQVNTPILKTNNYNTNSVFISDWLSTEDLQPDILRFQALNNISLDEGTIHVYIEKNELLATPSDTEYDIFTMPTSGYGEIILYRKADISNTVWAIKTSDGQNNITTIEYTDNQTTGNILLSVTWEKDEYLKLYFNGELVNTVENPYLPERIGEYLFIGSYNGTSNFLNSFIHDFLISEEARDDERIYEDFVALPLKYYNDSYDFKSTSKLLIDNTLQILRTKTLYITRSLVKSNGSVTSSITYEADPAVTLNAIHGIADKDIIFPEVTGETNISIPVSETGYISFKISGSEDIFLIKYIIGVSLGDDGNELDYEKVIKTLDNGIQFLDYDLEYEYVTLEEDFIKIDDHKFITKKRYQVYATGDINFDRQVTIQDVILAQKILSGELTPTPAMMLRADVFPLVNGIPSPDSRLTQDDIDTILNKALGNIDW